MDVTLRLPETNVSTSGFLPVKSVTDTNIEESVIHM